MKSKGPSYNLIYDWLFLKYREVELYRQNYFDNFI